ncbi:MAG: hypothetical protein KF760_28590 [Candidatus Eremiobacteraeota bacterium]|nr:hypothetical protein [Candidatus Eremiobacteraeota bacterium]MCW5865854.1 hypothetical protein [Candidatus Eremiobacteraeota bacterium]
MSERLLLPREWAQKSIAPVWKWVAIAGWAIALLLAQCLIIVLARPGRPPAPPPLAKSPAPPPKNHNDLEVARCLARLRCLVAVGRSQEALAETIRCLSLCQRLEIDPPIDLPVLFAQTVTSLSNHSGEAPSRHPGARPARSPRAAPPPELGRLPGPGYPQAPPRPRLAQRPPVSGPYPMMPPPAPPQPTGGPYEFQPDPPAPGY